MSKNKLVLIMFVLIMLFSIAGVVAVFIIKNSQSTHNSKSPTIDEILEESVDVPEITTNLVDGSYIKIALKIQTDSKTAQEELAKRDFEVKNIIIQELSQLKREQFNGKESMINLESIVKAQLNQVMQSGKIVKVYITSIILQ